MELAVFAIIMVVMFAAKIVSVMLTRDELVGKNSTMSWIDPQAQVEAPAHASEAPSKAPVRVYVTRRPGIA